jgi:hypothetical protein
MKNTKFVVKVNRGGTRAPEYVQRVDRTPIQTTTNRKLALLMGRFTAEDAAKSVQTSRCSSELVSVPVNSGQHSVGTRLGVRSWAHAQAI